MISAIKKTLQLSPLFLVLVALAFQFPSVTSATVVTPHQLKRPDVRSGQTGPYISSGNVMYYGGLVMNATSNVYAIYWEPTGSYIDPLYNRLINRYFQDVGNGTGTIYHNNIQYYEFQNPGPSPRQAVLAGRFLDTRPYPGNPLMDADIQSEINAVQAQTGWVSSIHNIFFVFTARGENICNTFGSPQLYCSFAPQYGFCGYHEFFGPQSSPTIYAAIPYTSVDPSLCGVPGFNGTYANGNYDADTTISVTSHEQMEAATDPLLNAWHDPLYPNGDGYEIADKCSSQFGTLNPDGSNVNWNGHPYIVQEEWDNTISQCVLYGP